MVLDIKPILVLFIEFEMKHIKCIPYTDPKKEEALFLFLKIPV